MAKARGGGFAYFLEAGETAHSICLEWVAQASGELCLDSSLPLMCFASVLQAANMPLLPKFRTVFGAAGGHRSLQNYGIQQITRWTKVFRLVVAAASSRPSHSTAQLKCLSQGSVACASDLSLKRSQAISLQQ